MHPIQEPRNSGLLRVSDIHEIYWEESGNPDGPRDFPAWRPRSRRITCLSRLFSIQSISASSLSTNAVADALNRMPVPKTTPHGIWLQILKSARNARHSKWLVLAVHGAAPVADLC